MPPDLPSDRDTAPGGSKASLFDRLSSHHSRKVNEAITRCVLKSEAVGYFICSDDGVIREANDAFQRMLQYTPEDIASGSLSWQRLTPPEYFARDTEIGREIVTRGSCLPYEKQYFRRDGTRLDVLIIASRIYGSDDFSTVTLVFDISAQKRTGELVATNLFLDTLLEHIPGVIFVKDAQTLRYIRLNNATEELLDRSTAEILGKTDSEIFSKEEAAKFVALDKALLATGETVVSTPIPLHVNNQVRIFQSKEVLVRDPQGEPQYIMGISEDITEKSAAEAERLALAREQAAREEAERVAARLKILSEASALVSSSLDYRTTLQNLARSVVPALADGCVVEMFSAKGERETMVMEHALGKEHSFLEEQSFYDIASDDDTSQAYDVARHGPRFAANIESEAIHQYTPDPIKRAQIEKIAPLSYIAVPLNLRGSILGTMTLVTTKHSGRRYDENDFRLVQELARHAALAVDNARLYLTSLNLHRSKDEFLAMLSHELRTPLSVIQGYAEILATDGEDFSNEERQDCYDIILRNAEHQTRIVTDLLDVSALITGKLSFYPQAIAPAEVVASVIQNVAPSAEAKSITLTLLSENVPTSIVADSTRFQQIVWNLLSNAIKFTPQGGTVTTTLRRVGDAFVMEVVDTGIGMDADFIPQVFDRFRQEDSSVTRRFGGLGLGLAIVRHMVELHGGEVKAESQGKGCGSKFTVTLPIVGSA